MPFGIPDKFHLILASRSPRRRQLLEEAGLRFDVQVMEYDEGWPPDLMGREIAEYLSARKAEQFIEAGNSPEKIIITADTVVWCDGMVLDKPADYDDAFRILRTISDNTHEVITGVSFMCRKKIHTFSEVTKVSFGSLTDEEIDYYIKRYKPFDKAGSYGIQEWIGIVGNSSIEGSYFNVMGLPVNRLLTELKEFIAVLTNDQNK